MLTRLVVALALVAACGGRPAAHETVKVAAAADLSFAFDELGQAFTAKTGQKIVFSYGSSGQLARQIEEGAPFDLLAAANVSFVDEVVKAGACDGGSKARYAQGRLVLWARAGGQVAITTSLQDLADPKFVKIAIANPEHAPYGKAAKEALMAVGVWDAVEPKLVYGENIKQTMQFADSGNVEAAIVARSLAVVARDGTYAEIDPALHQPLDQALVVCRNGKNAAGAQAFAAFVGSSEGRAVMKKYGFVLPEASAQK
jgi:molybdate transport system substrate-binding protein